jgi:hypothetical protein
MLFETELFDHFELSNQSNFLKGSIDRYDGWKIGRSFTMSEMKYILNSFYFLVSFLGLILVLEIIKGVTLNSQKNLFGDYSLNKSKKEKSFALEAIKSATSLDFELVCVFSEPTLPKQTIWKPILHPSFDGYWYDSNLLGLEYLYSKLANVGCFLFVHFCLWKGYYTTATEDFFKFILTQKIANTSMMFVTLTRNAIHE